MGTIFISPASEDRDLAEDIYHALEGAGHTAYLDKKDLVIGKEYNIAIRELVDASDFFVFLIAPESVRQGSYALTELSYAEDRWRKQPEGVVPVMVRPVDPRERRLEMWSRVASSVVRGRKAILNFVIRSCGST